jgi:hypothetical protein
LIDKLVKSNEERGPPRSSFLKATMKRRTLLCAGAALLVGWPLAPALAHTPYRQWDIFRRRYLQMLTSRSDLDGDAVGDDWVAQLKQRLPLSRAMVSRARDMGRVASLLKTDQARLAVLSHDDARRLASGLPPFDEFAPLPLQVMLANASHVLVARENLPLHHAFAIAAALLEDSDRLGLTVPLDGLNGMALHPGARAAALGESIESPVAEAT